MRTASTPAEQLAGKNSDEKEALGHRYLLVTYVTIDGSGGSTRLWSYKVARWLSARTGVLIVGLREL